MENKHCEVIYFFEHALYYWACVPLKGPITVAQVIQDLPWDIDNSLEVGIFGQKVTWEHNVSPGDRIEIYQPLIMTPNELRKKRQRGS